MVDTSAPARPENGLSRRTLMKGAAWAAPVIAVAVAAPAWAASGVTTCAGSVCIVDTAGIQVHKNCGGNNRMYWVCIPFKNTSTTASVTVSFSFNLVTSGGTVNLTASKVVPPNTTACLLATQTKYTTGKAISSCGNGAYPAFELTFGDGTTTGTATVPGSSGTAGNIAPACASC